MYVRLRGSALIVEQGRVLLVEFCDENGVHYNLPAGGVQEGESIPEAVKREAWEEASAQVEVGSLVMVVEYEPQRLQHRSGPNRGVDFIFECRLLPGSVPRMPEKPDENQTGVKWVPMSELDRITLYPELLAEKIREYFSSKKCFPFYARL
jgi:8-oxo-dGTP diphosphatase